jgi:hypothetical protein
MSLVGVVILLSALITAGLLLVFVVALVRHMKLLAGSLRTFSDQVRPVLEHIRQETETTHRRMEGLSERTAGLSRDARLRR